MTTLYEDFKSVSTCLITFCSLKIGGIIPRICTSVWKLRVDTLTSQPLFHFKSSMLLHRAKKQNVFINCTVLHLPSRFTVTWNIFTPGGDETQFTVTRFWCLNSVVRLITSWFQADFHSVCVGPGELSNYKSHPETEVNLYEHVF